MKYITIYYYYGELDTCLTKPVYSDMSQRSNTPVLVANINITRTLFM